LSEIAIRVVAAVMASANVAVVILILLWDARAERGVRIPSLDDYDSADSQFTGKVLWVQIDLGEDADDHDHLQGDVHVTAVCSTPAISMLGPTTTPHPFRVMRVDVLSPRLLGIVGRSARPRSQAGRRSRRSRRRRG
jgi:hypothetical protein